MCKTSATLIIFPLFSRPALADFSGSEKCVMVKVYPFPYSSFDLVTRCADCGVTDKDGQAPALAGKDVARGEPRVGGLRRATIRQPRTAYTTRPGRARAKADKDMNREKHGSPKAYRGQQRKKQVRRKTDTREGGRVAMGLASQARRGSSTSRSFSFFGVKCVSDEHQMAPQTRKQ